MVQAEEELELYGARVLKFVDDDESEALGELAGHLGAVEQAERALEHVDVIDQPEAFLPALVAFEAEASTLEDARDHLPELALEAGVSLELDGDVSNVLDQRL